MLGSVTIGIMLGAGAGAWVYSKTMNKTGGNTKQAVTVALIAGGVAFLLLVSLLSLVPAN